MDAVIQQDVRRDLDAHFEVPVLAQRLVSSAQGQISRARSQAEAILGYMTQAGRAPGRVQCSKTPHTRQHASLCAVQARQSDAAAQPD